jgi:hypothetical protein
LQTTALFDLSYFFSYYSFGFWLSLISVGIGKNIAKLVALVFTQDDG